MTRRRDEAGPDGPPGDGSRGDGPGHALQLALFAAGLLLLNFPMLMIWDKPVTVFGLPLLPVALFAIWAVLIGLLAVASEGRHDDD